MKGMLQRFSNRRSFLKYGIATAGAATAGTVLIGRGLSAVGGRPERRSFHTG
jgi:TAT (twin-arginine translocation) pathway signal sequence